MSDQTEINVTDSTFAAYVDAAEAAFELAEQLLANSPAYQQAAKRRDEAWEKCLPPGASP